MSCRNAIKKSYLLSFQMLAVQATLLALTTSASTTGSWSEWSDWSICTRSCDGGVRSRVRHCFTADPSAAPCPGPTKDHQICNIAPCHEGGGGVDDPSSFRTKQCTQYNDVPYQVSVALKKRDSVFQFSNEFLVNTHYRAQNECLVCFGTLLSCFFQVYEGNTYLVFFSTYYIFSSKL